MTVFEAIQMRRSVRAYSSQPIPDEVMQRMRQAMRFAPSAKNLQPWKFILVQDAALRREVARASREQMWMADAPMIVAACGLMSQAYGRMGGKYSSLDIDVAIAVDHLTLAAVAEGLGTCWIGAFSEDKVKELLMVPADVRIVAMTPLGFPATAGLNRPVLPSHRKPEAEIFSTNRFQE